MEQGIQPRPRVNTMPLNVAEALIRRAWIGRVPPTWISFREQDWSELPPDGVKERVVGIVAKAVECDGREVRWLVEHITASFALIFATRPLPSAAYVARLRELLPSALLFFMGGNEDRLPPVEGVVQLPVGAKEGMRFMQAYKRLMDRVAPRPT